MVSSCCFWPLNEQKEHAKLLIVIRTLGQLCTAPSLFQLIFVDYMRSSPQCRPLLFIGRI